MQSRSLKQIVWIDIDDTLVSDRFGYNTRLIPIIGWCKAIGWPVGLVSKRSPDELINLALYSDPYPHFIKNVRKFLIEQSCEPDFVCLPYDTVEAVTAAKQQGQPASEAFVAYQYQEKVEEIATNWAMQYLPMNVRAQPDYDYKLNEFKDKREYADLKVAVSQYINIARSQELIEANEYKHYQLSLLHRFYGFNVARGVDDKGERLNRQLREAYRHDKLKTCRYSKNEIECLPSGLSLLVEGFEYQTDGSHLWQEKLARAIGLHQYAFSIIENEDFDYEQAPKLHFHYAITYLLQRLPTLKRELRLNVIYLAELHKSQLESLHLTQKAIQAFEDLFEVAIDYQRSAEENPVFIESLTNNNKIVSKQFLRNFQQDLREVPSQNRSILTCSVKPTSIQIINTLYHLFGSGITLVWHDWVRNLKVNLDRPAIIISLNALTDVNIGEPFNKKFIYEYSTLVVLPPNYVTASGFQLKNEIPVAYYIGSRERKSQFLREFFNNNSSIELLYDYNEQQTISNEFSIANRVSKRYIPSNLGTIKTLPIPDNGIDEPFWLVYNICWVVFEASEYPYEHLQDRERVANTLHYLFKTLMSENPDLTNLEEILPKIINKANELDPFQLNISSVLPFLADFNYQDDKINRGKVYEIKTVDGSPVRDSAVVTVFESGDANPPKLEHYYKRGEYIIFTAQKYIMLLSEQAGLAYQKTHDQAAWRESIQHLLLKKDALEAQKKLFRSQLEQLWTMSDRDFKGPYELFIDEWKVDSTLPGKSEKIKIDLPNTVFAPKEQEKFKLNHKRMLNAIHELVNRVVGILVYDKGNRLDIKEMERVRFELRQLENELMLEEGRKSFIFSFPVYCKVEGKESSYELNEYFTDAHTPIGKLTNEQLWYRNQSQFWQKIRSEDLDGALKEFISNYFQEKEWDSDIPPFNSYPDSRSYLAAAVNAIVRTYSVPVNSKHAVLIQQERIDAKVANFLMAVIKEFCPDISYYYTQPSTVRDREGLSNYVHACLFDKEGNLLVEAFRSSSMGLITKDPNKVRSFERLTANVRNARQEITTMASLKIKRLQLNPENYSETNPLRVKLQIDTILSPLGTKINSLGAKVSGKQSENEHRMLKETHMAISMLRNRPILINTEEYGEVWVQADITLINTPVNNAFLRTATRFTDLQSHINARGIYENCVMMDQNIYDSIDLEVAVSNKALASLRSIYGEILSNPELKQLRKMIQDLVKKVDELNYDLYEIQRRYLYPDLNDTAFLEKTLKVDWKRTRKLIKEKEAELGALCQRYLNKRQALYAEEQIDVVENGLHNYVNQSLKNVSVTPEEIQEIQRIIREMRDLPPKEIKANLLSQGYSPALVRVVLLKDLYDRLCLHESILQLSKNNAIIFGTSGKWQETHYCYWLQAYDMTLNYLMGGFSICRCKSGEDRTGQLIIDLYKQSIFYKYFGRIAIWSRRHNDRKLLAFIALAVYEFSACRETNAANAAGAYGLQIESAPGQIPFDPENFDKLIAKIAKKAYKGDLTLPPALLYEVPILLNKVLAQIFIDHGVVVSAACIQDLNELTFANIFEEGKRSLLQPIWNILQAHKVSIEDDEFLFALGQAETKIIKEFAYIRFISYFAGLIDIGHTKSLAKRIQSLRKEIRGDAKAIVKATNCLMKNSLSQKEKMEEAIYQLLFDSKDLDYFINYADYIFDRIKQDANIDMLDNTLASIVLENLRKIFLASLDTSNILSIVEGQLAKSWFYRPNSKSVSIEEENISSLCRQAAKIMIDIFKSTSQHERMPTLTVNFIREQHDMIGDLLQEMKRKERSLPQLLLELRSIGASTVQSVDDSSQFSESSFLDFNMQYKEKVADKTQVLKADVIKLVLNYQRVLEAIQNIILDGERSLTLYPKNHQIYLSDHQGKPIINDEGPVEIKDAARRVVEVRLSYYSQIIKERLSQCRQALAVLQIDDITTFENHFQQMVADVNKKTHLDDVIQQSFDQFVDEFFEYVEDKLQYYLKGSIGVGIQQYIYSLLDNMRENWKTPLQDIKQENSFKPNDDGLPILKLSILSDKQPFFVRVPYSMHNKRDMVAIADLISDALLWVLINKGPIVDICNARFGENQYVVIARMRLLRMIQNAIANIPVQIKSIESKLVHQTSVSFWSNVNRNLEPRIVQLDQDDNEGMQQEVKKTSPFVSLDENSEEEVHELPSFKPKQKT